MKPSFGIGILVAVLISASAALFGLVSLQGALSLLLLLAGAWSILSAFILVESGDRMFYAGWGIVIAGLSLSYFIPLQYAVGLVLVAIIGLIVVYAYLARAPKASHPPS